MTTYKTLASLKNHPAVRGIDMSRNRAFVRGHGFPIVVSLKAGFWNTKHAVNVVMGNKAAEVLSFFNEGHVKAESDMSETELHFVR